MAKIIIDPEKLDCMASRLKVLTHPDRVTIIELLQKNGKLAVGEIVKALKISQAATSNHLRILKDQQIVSSARAGQKELYSLREAKLAAIINCIENCV